MESLKVLLVRYEHFLEQASTDTCERIGPRNICSPDRPRINIEVSASGFTTDFTDELVILLMN